MADVHPELEKIDVHTRSRVLERLWDSRQKAITAILEGADPDPLVKAHHKLCYRQFHELGIRTPWRKVEPELEIPESVDRLTGKAVAIKPPISCKYCGESILRCSDVQCVKNLRLDDSRRIRWDKGFSSARSKFQLTQEEAKDYYVQMGRAAYARFNE